ncbi:MAG: AAA family ATPase [Marinicaulis sp.]|nr:AAA family ATPase [Marinicaulis sp.]
MASRPPRGRCGDVISHGLFLGKFMPPHRGHRFVCETALNMVDELTVLVCSTDAEPIDGALRAAWMAKAIPGANIVHMHRDIPQGPADHPDFWEIWEAAIREHAPQPISHVFGSEPYIFRLANDLNATPVMIDPDREIYPVAASDIRDDPAEHWRDLLAPARPYFQKRLCILGPESSGKTVLARKLADTIGGRALPEYGRAYDVHYMQSGSEKGADWAEDGLVALARTHAAMRRAMAADAGPVLVEDTDIIQTAIWAEHLLGQKSEILEAMIAKENLADHYIVLSPNVEWIDDGVRYAGGAQTRAWFYDAAVARLTALDVPFDIIQEGDWSAREEKAMEILGHLMRRR